jgi:hypothetical protein
MPDAPHDDAPGDPDGDGQGTRPAHRFHAPSRSAPAPSSGGEGSA